MTAHRMHALPATKHHQTGFTIVEVMVVILLITMLTLTASSVFMTMLAGRAKNASNQIIKSEGEQAMHQMEFLIRNAVAILPDSAGVTCSESPVMTELNIKSVDGGVTRLYLQTDTSDSNKVKIASNSGIFLTSSAIDNINNFRFTCVENPDSGNRFVTLEFRLYKNGKDQTFNSIVNMRNY